MVRILTQSMKIMSIPITAVMIIIGGIMLFDMTQDVLGGNDTRKSVTIIIDDEDDSGAVAEALASADLIRWTSYFQLRMRMSQAEIQPGTYVLSTNMSVADIIDTIAGDS